MRSNRAARTFTGAASYVAGLATLIGASVVLEPPALAQDEVSKATARKLAQDGIVAAQEGRCEDAVAILLRAKQLAPVPSVLVPLGECQAKLGKVVAGTENLQQAARESLAADAPKAFLEAQERARTVLPDLLAKLGRLRINAKAGTATVIVTDNGDAVPAVTMGVERPADPGKHVIEVRATGFLTSRVEVDVRTGQSATVELELKPDPNAAPVTQSSPSDTQSSRSAPDREPDRPPPESSALVPVGAVALGVGGAGLFVGAVLGIVASGKQSDLDEVCPNKVCPASSQEDIDSMSSLATGSTVGFILGGIGVAAGATLLTIGLTSGPSRSDTAGVRANVGLGRVGFDGRF